jgi:hypothetical protein
MVRKCQLRIAAWLRGQRDGAGAAACEESVAIDLVLQRLVAATRRNDELSIAQRHVMRLIAVSSVPDEIVAALLDLQDDARRPERIAAPPLPAGVTGHLDDDDDKTPAYGHDVVTAYEPPVRRALK